VRGEEVSNRALRAEEDEEGEGRTSESAGFQPSSLRRKAMTVRNWLLAVIL